MGITFYMLNTFKVPYFELHYYPDNDESGSKEVMDKMVHYLKPFNCPIYIHRNMYEGQKDFGVDLNHIKESVILM